MDYTPDRISITLGEKPMIGWNLVAGADSYSFKVEDKSTPPRVLWDVEVKVTPGTPAASLDEFRSSSVQPPNFKSYGGCGTFSYPDGAESLKEKTTYVFSAEAKGSGITPKTFKSDLLSLETEAYNAAQELQDAIVKSYPALEDSWLKLKDLISISGGMRSIDPDNITESASRWYIFCITAQFKPG